MHVESFSPINSKWTLSRCTPYSTGLLYYLTVIYRLGEEGLFMASLQSQALFIQDLGLGVKRHPGKPFLSHPHGKIHRQGLACTAITVYNGIYWSPSGMVGLEKVIIFLCAHFFVIHRGSQQLTFRTQLQKVTIFRYTRSFVTHEGFN